MAKLVFEDTQDEFEVPDGSSIVDACEQAGVPVACNEGVCGTCVIEVVEGMENLSKYNDTEAEFLGPNPVRERLACQCKVKCGTVKIKF